MKDKKILALIVTYNAALWYEKTINSLLTSSYPVDILVVDNCSTDATVSISRQKFPEVTLIENPVNAGFGGANNIGLQWALEKNYDFVFLLNQDAWIEEDTIEELVSASSAHPDFGILSPVHLNGTGEMIDHLLFRNIAKHPCGRAFFSDLLTGKGRGRVYELTFVNAAAWLLTRQCLRTVGFFDPIFNHYGEDNNYCHRVEFHSFRIGVVASAFVYHDRENRYGSKPVWADDAELELKLALANVLNPNIEVAYRQRRKQLLKESLRALASGKLQRFKTSLEKISLMRRLFPQIRESYTRNRKPAF